MIKMNASLRVIRGGSWFNYAGGCGVDSGSFDYPDNMHNDLSIRVLRKLQQNKGGD